VYNAKLRRVICILFIFAFVLSFLASCARDSGADYVTDQKLSNLRKKYKFSDTQPQTVSMLSYESAYPTFDAVLGINKYEKYNSFSAIVVLEFEGDWYDVGTKIHMYDDDELNSVMESRIPGFGGLGWTVHDAIVRDVVWGSDQLDIGDRITVGFGSKVMTTGVGYEEIFTSDNQYVCFLFDESNLSFNIDNLYSTAKPYSFYLTDKDVILSVTSAPGPDSVSGMYLDAFTTLVNETLGPPDAELTPVEPELETE